MEIGTSINNDITITAEISKDDGIYRGISKSLEREVIVRRVNRNDYDNTDQLLDRDIKGLNSNHRNPNVIVYLGKYQVNKLFFICYDNFDVRLKDAIHNKDLDADIKSILFGATKGLKFIHENRDIRPENIVVCRENGENVGKSLNFSLSKPLIEGQSQVSNSGGFESAADAYTSSELFNKGKCTAKTDIFSMGCAYYYAFTGNVLYFKYKTNVRGNILNPKFKKNFEPLQKSEKVKPYEVKLLKQLIESMTKFKAEDRPTAENVLNHPFYWDEDEIMDFFIAVKGYICSGTKSKYKSSLNANFKTFNTKELNKTVRTALFDPKYPKSNYDFSQVVEILRAIRNLKSHCDERKNLNAGVGEFFESEGGIATYFLKLCPDLLYHVYTTIQGTELKSGVLKRF